MSIVIGENPDSMISGQAPRLDQAVSITASAATNHAAPITALRSTRPRFAPILNTFCSGDIEARRCRLHNR
jgi:hypothetical protein